MKVKNCESCGVEILYGVNGCQMSDECFNCKPLSYKKLKRKRRSADQWDAIDAMEGTCIGPDDLD